MPMTDLKTEIRQNFSFGKIKVPRITNCHLPTAPWKKHPNKVSNELYTSQESQDTNIPNIKISTV